MNPDGYDSDASGKDESTCGHRRVDRGSAIEGYPVEQDGYSDDIQYRR